jgi:hypothetical protein
VVRAGLKKILADAPEKASKTVVQRRWSKLLSTEDRYELVEDQLAREEPAGGGRMRPTRCTERSEAKRTMNPDSGWSVIRRAIGRSTCSLRR